MQIRHLAIYRQFINDISLSPLSFSCINSYFTTMKEEMKEKKTGMKFDPDLRIIKPYPFISKVFMRKSFIWTAILITVIFTAGLFLLYSSLLDIRVTRQDPVQRILPDTRPQVFFGVVSRYSPHLLYEGYQPLMDYLSRQTPFRFRLKLSHSYDETIEQLRNGQVVAAFLGTYIYLKSRKKDHLHCILKPLNKEGKPFFRSVVITGSHNTIRTLSDLQNKRLALPSPLSYSANWLFFERRLSKKHLALVRYFNFHNTVVYQVLKGNFDAGVVKDRVANAFTNKGIRIIYRSAPIPASPIVVHQNTNPQISKAITDALLKIDIRQPKFKKLVESWDAEFRYGFVPARDADYVFMTGGGQ